MCQPKEKKGKTNRFVGPKTRGGVGQSKEKKEKTKDY